MATAVLDTKTQLKRAETKQNIKRNISGWLFVLPFMAVFVFYHIVPLFWGIFTSFLYQYNPWDSTKTILDYTFTIDNYVSVITCAGKYAQIGRQFWKALGTTMLFDVIAVPVMIIFPLAMAYLVNLEPPGYKIFRAVIYLPSVLSQAVMGSVFLLIFANNEFGYINSFLKD